MTLLSKHALSGECSQIVHAFEPSCVKAAFGSLFGSALISLKTYATFYLVIEAFYKFKKKIFTRMIEC